MSEPSADRSLWREYLVGAERSYRRHGVSAALDVDAIRRADDTTLFWAVLDPAGRVVGGVRATSAAHVLERWRSSGGVVASMRSTPYPDERYRTKMMWWDRLTSANHGEPDQFAKIFSEMEDVRRRLDSRPLEQAR